VSRKRFDDMPCSIARTLDVVREAFLGVRRFSELHAHLGIARNILADRLQRLVAQGILVRQAKEPPRKGYEYRLTEKGRDLWGVLTALRLWGDKWVYGSGKEPLVVRDREHGAALAQLLPADAEGNLLDRRRLVAEPDLVLPTAPR